MTVTIRQAEANPKNAEMSTGPKTDAGKEASSRNAAKHGLTGMKPTEGEQAEFEVRLEIWRQGSSFGAVVAGQPDRELLFQQMVLQTIRLDRARDREFDLIAAGKARAKLAWEADRNLEAQTIGKTLSKQPGLAVAKLGCFLQGVEWLIEQWENLERAILEAGHADPGQIRLMYDLMGASLDFRPDYPDGLAKEEVLPRIEEWLKSLKTGDLPRLVPLNDYDRQLAEKGFQPQTSREELLNRRYESLAERRFHQAMKTLTELGRQPVPAAGPTQAAPPPVAALNPNATAKLAPAAPSSAPAGSKPNTTPAAKINDRPLQGASSAPFNVPVSAAQNEPDFKTGKINTTLTPMPQQRSA